MANNSQMSNSPNNMYSLQFANSQATQQSQQRQTQQSGLDSEKKKQRSTTTRRKQGDSDVNRNKSEFEGHQDLLKSLMDKYGHKSKVLENIQQEQGEIQQKINLLQRKALQKGKANFQEPPQLPKAAVLSLPPPSQPSQQNQGPPEQAEWQPFSLFRTIWWLVTLPLALVFQVVRATFGAISWTWLLSAVAMTELALVGTMWLIRRQHHNYLYVEPYEPIVHGTYGVDDSATWGFFFSTAVDTVWDFFGEVMNGGRGFGSPGYSGFVPI